MIKNSVIIGIVFLALVSIFTFQRKSFSFENGHQGWVSSHALSMMNNATYENNYVGFGFKKKISETDYTYGYFDRYPIFFLLISHELISPEKTDIKKQLMISRTIMNVIFVLTFAVLFLILYSLNKNTILSLCVTFFAMSGSFIIFYKEMFHFDQPALFGGLLGIYAIIRRYQKKEIIWPLVLIVISCLFGRAYFSAFIYLTWVLVSAVFYFRNRRAVVQKNLIFAIMVLFLSGTLCGSLLAYNIYSEAKVRNISIMDVGIIKSATYRLGFSEEFETEKSISTSIWNVVPKLINRHFYNLIPFVFKIKEPQSNNAIGVTYLVLFIFLSAYFLKRKRILFSTEEEKIIYYTMALCGVIWLVVMRRLSIFHDYTTMYLLPLVAIQYQFLISRFKDKQIKNFIFPCSFLVFLFSLYAGQNFLDKRGNEFESFAEELSRVDKTIQGQSIYSESFSKFNPRAPYIVYFFIQKNEITEVRELANYELSNKPISSENLLGHTQHIYLVKK